jgi:tRNA U55 pseudouridine synthase TruB
MDIVTKPTGQTMGELVKEYKAKHPDVKKACFCGRLDPMARGQVLLLLNNNCKKMPDYLGKNKIYQFEIILGFQTDTDDFMGLCNYVNNNYINREYNFNKIKKQIIKYIDKYKGKEFEQKFHNYSTKKIIKSDNIDEYHKVKIYDVKHIEDNTYNYNEWRLKNINIVKNVTGEFRQQQICDNWSSIDYNENINSIKFEIKVSSGFYIRQFVRDISTNIQFPLLTFDINRINILL